MQNSAYITNRMKFKAKAGYRIRTCDLLITKQVLYRLS